jgi:hypothetical protein
LIRKCHEENLFWTVINVVKFCFRDMPRAAHGVQYRQGPHQDYHRMGGEVLQVIYSAVSTFPVLYKGGAGSLLCRLEVRQATRNTVNNFMLQLAKLPIFCTCIERITL